MGLSSSLRPMSAQPTSLPGLSSMMVGFPPASRTAWAMNFISSPLVSRIPVITISGFI